MNTKLSGKSDTHSHPYLNTANVANNLTTTSAGYALDARQGKALNDALAGKVTSGSQPTFNGIHLGSGNGYIYPGGDNNNDIYFRFGNDEYVNIRSLKNLLNQTHIEWKSVSLTKNDSGAFWLGKGAYIIIFNGLCHTNGTGATKNTAFSIFNFTTGYSITTYAGMIIGNEQYCSMCCYTWIGEGESYQIGIKCRLDGNQNLLPTDLNGAMTYIKFV